MIGPVFVAVPAEKGGIDLDFKADDIKVARGERQMRWTLGWSICVHYAMNVRLTFYDPFLHCITLNI